LTESWAGLVESLAGILVGLDNSASVRLLSAFFADTINLEGVARSNVTVCAADFALDLADFLGEKFYGGTAIGTYHVMMTAPVVLVLVTRYPIMKGDFTGQAATCEELQGAIDGRETYARIGLFDQSMQFVDGEMFTSFEEGPQDGIALFGLLQAHATEMLKENSLGFANTLSRDGRLIVDSLLQHGC
jgi:hypothetical protein